MAEPQDVAEDLLSYATYLVKRLVRAHSVEWDHARMEDAAQTLFLAGWQVWRNERNIALAKNRMKSRRANLLRDFFNQRKRERQFPEPSKDRSEPMQPGDLWNENSVRDRQAKSKFGRLRDDPSEEASKNDYIDQLPQRQRQIRKKQIAVTPSPRLMHFAYLDMRKRVHKSLSIYVLISKSG